MLNAMLEQHRVVTSFESLEAFVHDGVSQNGGGGCAVTGDVVGLLGGFLKELGAHVLKRIFEFDFLRNGNAVVRDGGGTELAVHSHVAALGAKGCAHRIGNDIHAVLELAAGVF